MFSFPIASRMRFKRKSGLSTHFKKHSVGKLPEDIAPSARKGKTLPKIEKKRKGCVREQMKKARQKGFSAKTRVRDIEMMKAGVKAYEDALKSGETAQEYEMRTGITKQKISGWRQSIKNKRSK